MLTIGTTNKSVVLFVKLSSILSDDNSVRNFLELWNLEAGSPLKPSNQFLLICVTIYALTFFVLGYKMIDNIKPFI